MIQTVMTTFEPPQFSELMREVVKEELQKIIPQLQQFKEPEKEYLTRAEVCTKLSISLGTLHTATKAGKIKSHRIGRRVLYKPDEVNAAIQSRNFRAIEEGRNL
jgi:excisionase family DNA binding protein